MPAPSGNVRVESPEEPEGLSMLDPVSWGLSRLVLAIHLVLQCRNNVRVLNQALAESHNGFQWYLGMRSRDEKMEVLS